MNYSEYDSPYQDPQSFEFIDRQQQAFPAEYLAQMGDTVPFMAPPSFSPPIPAWQVGSRGIRSCVNRNTYIWLTNGSSLWFFPTFVGFQFLVGFRWSRMGWTRSFIRLNTIRSFQCF